MKLVILRRALGETSWGLTCAVNDSPALIHGVTLFIVGPTVLYALVKWSRHINVMERDHENRPKPDPPPFSCSLPSTLTLPL